MSNRTYTLEKDGPKIEDFLKRVLAAAHLRIQFTMHDGDEAAAYFEKPQLVVKFHGQDIEYLLANKGEALIALEQLTQEMLRMFPDEHALLCFDANDFRLLRMEELRLSAQTVAERVKQSGTPFRFNPMTSRERRIVHLALRDETALRSESSGVGPGRHVVIYPAGMPSLPEPPPGPPPGRTGSGRDHRDSGRGGGAGRDRDRRSSSRPRR